MSFNTTANYLLENEELISILEIVSITSKVGTEIGRSNVVYEIEFSRVN